MLIFLVGFMGSGKTTVGQALAARLKCRFLDLDARIESAAGCSIPEIFDRQGEPAFRELETRALREALRELEGERAGVVALGGGAFAQANNIEMIEATIERAGGLTVWLDAPAPLLIQRCALECDSRPLARDPDRFRSLYRERLPFYARARMRVDASDPAAIVVEKILAGAGLLSRENP